MISIHNRFIDIFIENPFKTWWKAKKYFKRPKLSFGFFPTHNGKFLKINCHDILWKDKYDSPRHEINPYIEITLFNLFGFSIQFHTYYKDEFGIKQVGNIYYWEYLLSWLYYYKKKTLICYSTWTYNSKLYKYISEYGDNIDGSEDVIKPLKLVIPCVALSLNKKGIKKLKEELNNS